MEIILDAGEPPGNGGNTLLLATLKVYLLGSGSISGYNATNFPDSAIKYEMGNDVQGAPNQVQLDKITGNGFSDMFLYIPKSKFTGTNPYLYLYSEFEQSGGTFEEWGVDPGEGEPVVPEPLSVILFGTGLVGAYFKRRNT